MDTLKTISIRNKIIFAITLAVILSTAIIGGMIQQKSKAIVRHRLLDIELPQTLDKITSHIDNQVELLVAACQQFANNTFVGNLFHKGQLTQQQLPALLIQLNQLRQQYGLSDATIAGRKSANFWNQTGFIRQMNRQQDSWFFDFVDSDKPTLVSMFREENGDMKMFVDYQQLNGQLMTSVGKSMTDMVSLLNHFKIEESGYVYLINAQGIVQVGQNNIKFNSKLQTLYADKAQALLNKHQFNLIQTQFNGQDVFVASQYIPSMDWFVVGMVPEHEIFADIHQITMQIIITTIIVAILFTLLAFILANGIANPIKGIAKRFSELGQGGGNLSQRLPIHGTDEIGQLSEGFNDFVEQIQQSMKEVASSSKVLQQEAEIVSQKSTLTRNNSQNQHDQSLLVVTAMHQMGATISEIASNAATASTNALLASSDTDKGRQVVHQAKDVIHHLAESIRHASLQVQQLASATDEIATILAVIQGVSDQTNLLALNAAIEAARAGDHGRGFAVVADEVRNLAKRTADSASEIQTMITKLQHDSKEAVDAMQTGQEFTQQGVEASEQAVAVLNEIYSHVQGISDVNIQVAAATEEQATTVESINQNIEGINEINMETTQTADELAQASKKLHDLSNSLNQLVGHFNL